MPNVILVGFSDSEVTQRKVKECLCDDEDASEIAVTDLGDRSSCTDLEGNPQPYVEVRSTDTGQAQRLAGKINKGLNLSVTITRAVQFLPAVEE